MITSDIPTGKGGGEKANYFIIIVHLLSSFIIGYHHLNLGFDSRRPYKLTCVSTMRKKLATVSGTILLLNPQIEPIAYFFCEV